MPDTQLWSKIHAERAEFADLIGTLTPEQLETQSLCGDWRVRDVVGHMISAAHTSLANFFPGLIASGFRFNTFTQKGTQKYGGGTAAELAERIRATTTRTSHPPGPAVVMLGEMIVHGEDVRRPLGVKHGYPAADIQTVGNFYKTSNLLLGSKKRIQGLTVRAEDADWSTGSGPEVFGPGAALLSAMTGRRAALDDLRGEGLEEFATRF